MSSTNTVVPATGSCLQSSLPKAPSSAVKKSAPFTWVNSLGVLLPPSLMSSTNTVPASVPLLLQSSTPLIPLSAAKKRMPFTLVSSFGLLLSEAWTNSFISLTSTVPLAVPLLFHSSTPLIPLSAAKNRVPLTLVNSLGELLPPGFISLIKRGVMLPVPLARQSSTPFVPLSAAKNSLPFTFVSPLGLLLLTPGYISLARITSAPASPTKKHTIAITERMVINLNLISQLLFWDREKLYWAKNKEF